MQKSKVKQPRKRSTPKAQNAPLPPEAYDRIPRVQITLTDETVWVTKFDPRGAETAMYPTTLAALATAFNVVGTSTGLIAPDILFIQNVRGIQRVGLWLAPARRALTLAGRKETTITIPLPGFVFIGQGARYWIYAALERPTKAHDSLFVAPLPNVHNDGHVCVGNVKFPKASAATMPDAAKLFFESEFNYDLAEDKIAPRRADGTTAQFDIRDRVDDEDEIPGDEFIDTGLRVENLHAFLCGLQTAKKFPRARLVRAGKTIREAMERQ